VSFYPEDEGSTIIRNIDTYLPDNTSSHPNTNYLHKYSCNNLIKDKFVSVHVMETYGGVEVWIYSFLTSTLKDEWFASCLGRFTHGK
jgi:hypothetical protein